MLVFSITNLSSNQALKRIYKKNSELLLVLSHPEIPLDLPQKNGQDLVTNVTGAY